MNGKYKNLIIATLASGIYYSNVIHGIPREKVIIAVVCMFLGVIAVMEVYDGIDEFRYGTRRFLTKYRFEKYKSKVEVRMEKKSQGKDEAWKKDFVTNYIVHDKRFAFSGKQIEELMSLATDAERNA